MEKIKKIQLKLMVIATIYFSILMLESLGAGIKKPSILFCSPKGADGCYIGLAYLKELHTKGYQVDYLDSFDDFTWKRIKKYNVLVLYMTPETRQYNICGGPKPKTGVNQAFVDNVMRFVEQGGGVFLFPLEVNRTKQALYDFTKLWGAHLPVEYITDGNPDNTTDLNHFLRGRGGKISYTTNIMKSPVNAGISQLWYPISHGKRYCHGGPIIVNDKWIVVAKASSTASTHPLDYSAGGNTLVDPFQCKRSVKEPVLMAIRSVGKGRVALINQWPQFTIGSGPLWLYDHQILSRGSGNRPSDWRRLLENTYDWLAVPSLTSGYLGGFVTPAKRLLPAFQQKTNPVYRDIERLKFDVSWEELQRQWQYPPQFVKPFRGLIGAKSAYGGGFSTVGEYVREAKKAGLDFIVFLDDFAALTPKKFASLQWDCQRLSDDKIALIPGFTIDANTGDHLFFFGQSISLPWKKCLCGSGSILLDLQPQDSNGKFTGYSNPDTFEYIYKYLRGEEFVGNVGYYNFTNDPASEDKKMKVSDLRFYGMAALRYYRDGKLMEDVTQDYLICAQGLIPPTPVSFNEIRSASALRKEIARSHSLTYVLPYSVNGPVGTILDNCLRWGCRSWVFPSDGPLIHAWPDSKLDYTLGSEEFVTVAALMPSRIEVSAENGLKEVKIYNGPELFRRFTFKGEKQFSTDLMLNKFIQRCLILIATDQNGKKAVSFMRQGYKLGGTSVLWCSDRFNGAYYYGNSLAHGPVPMLSHVVESMPYDMGGRTWDGGDSLLSRQLVYYYEDRPILNSSLGIENGQRFNQTPMLEFSDEGAIGLASLQNELFSSKLLKVLNPWHTCGPLAGPSKQFNSLLRWRKYTAPTLGSWQAGPPACYAYGLRKGINAQIFTNEITFKADAVINSLSLFRDGPGLPSVFPIFCAYGSSPNQVVETFVVTSTPRKEIKLEPGNWFAFYSGTGMDTDAHIFIVRGEPIKVILGGNEKNIRNWIYADIDGKKITKGMKRNFELLSFGVPMDISMNSTKEVLRFISYINNPGVKVHRGTKINAPGLIDVTVDDNYAAEVSVPNPVAKTWSETVTLPLRVGGLNRRWTAGLWQKQGYVLGNYGSGENRFREVGIDIYGYAYVPLYPTLAPKTRMVIGHPVSATGAGKDCFIEVLHLYDNPSHWYVAVNNPMDKPIKTTLKKSMDFPNFEFPDQEIEIPAGEYVVLMPEDKKK
jgi:hypothetical protein